MPKEKSKRQVGYLLSSGSPLTEAQKSKLKSELHSGAVKVKREYPGGPRGAPPPGRPEVPLTGLPGEVSAMIGEDFAAWSHKQEGGLTGAAYKLGREVKTQQEVDALLEGSRRASADLVRLREETKSADPKVKEAAEAQLPGASYKPQFFNEAYGAATGTGSGGQAQFRRDPNYKPPFPQGEKTEESRAIAAASVKSEKAMLAKLGIGEPEAGPATIAGFTAEQWQAHIRVRKLTADLKRQAIAEINAWRDTVGREDKLTMAVGPKDLQRAATEALKAQEPKAPEAAAAAG